MPNKTIYVKDSDLPLFEQAQNQLGESMSALFAEFLRERIAKVTPEENRILDLVNLLAQKRDALQKDRIAPAFLDGEFAEAAAFAERALKSLRAREVRKAKTFFYAANRYHEQAEQHREQARALATEINGLLEGKSK